MTGTPLGSLYLFVFTAFSSTNYYFSLSQAGPVFVSREVSDAIESRSAVVALESTIITHGMAYPANLE